MNASMNVHMNVVALADCPPQAWRNGGGLTHELLAWPPGAAAWQLRISVARIASDGPFSPFPGVRRCFAVLHGPGVRLRWSAPAAREQVLTAGSAAVAFDGADAPQAELLAGPTLDLNLMASTNAGRPELRRASAGGPALAGRTAWQGLYVTAPAAVQIDGSTHTLAADTLVWAADAAPGWRLTQLSPGHAWWLLLHPAEA